MKQILALALAFFSLLAVAAYADSFTGWTSTTAAGGSVLTIAPVNSGNTINIPEDAVVTVVNERGEPVKPQPRLHISPTKGKDATSYTVKRTDGDPFADTDRIKISKVNTTDNVEPEGDWDVPAN